MSEGRRRLTTIIDGASGSARAKAVFWAGRLAIHQDDYAAATPVLERSLALARDQEDPELISLCLSGLSFLATTHAGDAAKGAAFAAEAAAVARETGNSWALAEALNVLATARARSDSPGAAVALYEESLALRRTIQDRLMFAIPLHNIAWEAAIAGDHERAALFDTECLAVSQELGDKRSEAFARTGLANTALGSGAYDEATTRFLGALALSSKLDLRRNVASCLFGLAAVLASRGDREWAARLWGSAEDALAVMGIPRDPVEQRIVDGELAGLREDPQLNAAYAAGAALSLEEAIDFALSTNPGQGSARSREHPL